MAPSCGGTSVEAREPDLAVDVVVVIVELLEFLIADLKSGAVLLRGMLPVGLL